MQPVAEATEEDPELGLLAGMEVEEEGGVTAPVPSGRRRRHRSRKSRVSAEEAPLQPEAEGGDGAYSAPEGSPGAGAGPTVASFSQGPADVESGMGPRPPSVAKRDASRASSARIQPAGYSVSGRASFSMHPTEYSAAGRASFSAMPPLPASPSLHTSPSPFSGYAAQPLADSTPAPAPKKASWVVRGVSLTHKYTDPTEVDITITNAGGEPISENCLPAAVVPRAATLQASHMLGLVDCEPVTAASPVHTDTCLALCAASLQVLVCCASRS
jgi:hypothetical protein